jgi:hypothetical protein
MAPEFVHRLALAGLLTVAAGVAPGCHQEPEATPELPPAEPAPPVPKGQRHRKPIRLPGDSATTPDPNPGAHP